MVLRGDPSWRPSVAPVIRWAQEIWWAAFPKVKAVPALPLPFLKKAWKKAAAAPPDGWDSARGALDAAFLSLQRVGWTFADYDAVVTDQGVRVSLVTTSPKLLSKLLQEAVQRKWQRKMATGLTFNGWHGTRVCPDPIRAVTHSAWARTHCLEASYACRAFCDGIWTGDRAAEAGYDCQGMLCPLCNLAEDSLKHRITQCSAPEAVKVRSSFKKAFDVIGENIDRDKFYATRGIIQHPAERLPFPLRKAALLPLGATPLTCWTGPTTASAEAVHSATGRHRATLSQNSDAQLGRLSSLGRTAASVQRSADRFGPTFPKPLSPPNTLARLPQFSFSGVLPRSSETAWASSTLLPDFNKTEYPEVSTPASSETQWTATICT